MGLAATAVAILAVVVYFAAFARSNATLASRGPAAPPISVEAIGAVQREAPMMAPR